MLILACVTLAQTPSQSFLTRKNVAHGRRDHGRLSTVADAVNLTNQTMWV